MVVDNPSAVDDLAFHCHIHKISSFILSHTEQQYYTETSKRRDDPAFSIPEQIPEFRGGAHRRQHGEYEKSSYMPALTKRE